MGSICSRSIKTTEVCSYQPYSEETSRFITRFAPLLPKRVVYSFAESRFNCMDTGEVLCAPQPRVIEAAVLLVDIKGFTKLSELYAKHGAAGVEEFSLLVSSLFAAMTRIVRSHQGEIDCFAGDAFLVVFEDTGREPSDLPGGFETQASQLNTVICQAVSCIEHIAREMKRTRACLSIHGALAAGTLFSVEAGGASTPRMEAFLIGKPIFDLGRALPQAKEWELAVCASAKLAVCAARCRSQVRGEHQCIILDINDSNNGPPSQLKHKSCDSNLSTSSMVSKAAQRASAIYKLSQSQPAHPQLGLPSQVAPGSLLRTISSRNSKSGRLHQIPASSLSFMGKPIRQVFPERSKSSVHLSERDLEAKSGADHGELLFGLDALLRFVPWFVRQRCLSGFPVDMLAESRSVSILFVTGAFKTESVGLEKIRRLQSCVTQAIDIANGEFGAVTRQVTVDDKGLAMIFIFGLAGSAHPSHAWASVATGRRLFMGPLAENQDMELTGGTATGCCYCGLVGCPKTRCEYTVMGDPVNTAARLAGEARRLGLPFLCSNSTQESLKMELNGKSLLVQVGKVNLKGKLAEEPVFIPDNERLSRDIRRDSRVSLIVGRQHEISVLSRFVVGKNHEGDGPGVLLMTGRSGVGKTTLLRSLELAKLPVCDSSAQHGPALIGIHLSGQLHSAIEICLEVFTQLFELQGADGSTGDGLEDLEKRIDLTRTSPRWLPSRVRSLKRRMGYLREKHPVEKRRAIINMYGELIREGLERRPAVIILDDADKADKHVNIMLINSVIAQREKAPMRSSKLILVACNSSELTTSESSQCSFENLIQRGLATELRLHPLDMWYTEKMAASLLHSSRLSPALANWVLFVSRL
uniref:Guanylyl cyclase n=1 Tax=Tetraselmis sp. GSL018 TaxID=582737 RepID=A0A061SKC5_9CHLO